MLVAVVTYFCGQSAVKVTNCWVREPLKEGNSDVSATVGLWETIFFSSILTENIPPTYLLRNQGILFCFWEGF
jgi:hypothetical protein